jgi:hypothetical protein
MAANLGVEVAVNLEEWVAASLEVEMAASLGVEVEVKVFQNECPYATVMVSKCC